MKANALKYLSLSGIAGSILFTSVSLLCGFFKTEYDPIHNFISELGATNSSTENLMNSLGFIPSGLLFCLFGFSIFVVVTNNLTSKIGSILIMVFGLGMTLAGFFSCDVGCPPNGTMESIIHDRVSAVTFISAIVGIILLGFNLRKMRSFRSTSLYVTMTGFVSLILLVMMVNSFESRHLTGLWQRLLLLSIFTWAIIVGLKVYKNFNKLSTDEDK
jgi:hypothetical membrane protein